MRDPGFTVRPAVPSDVPAVAAMLRAWWDETHTDEPHLHPGPSKPASEGGHPSIFRGIEFRLQPDEEAVHAWRSGYHFVAERDGRLIGTVNGEIEQVTGTDMVTFDPNTSALYVSTLYVAPAERRSGVATALMRAILARAADDGIVDAALDSGWDDAVIAFYRRLGFEPYRVRYARRER